jgi:hypothetical protein
LELRKDLPSAYVIVLGFPLGSYTQIHKLIS